MNYEEGDLEKIIKIDEYAFGTNRKEFLKKRIMQSEVFVCLNRNLIHFVPCPLQRYTVHFA
jgi:hypothetical protein